MEEVWTTIAADGSRGPFYVNTSRASLCAMNIFDGIDAKLNYVPPLVNHLGRNVAPGERGALSYFQYMVEVAQYFKDGDLIIHDAEAALDTESVQLYLARFGIVTFVLPTTLHQFLSPLDNNFHSLLKLKYFRLVSDGNYATIDEKEKLELANLCYHDIGSDVIRSLFEKCGLVGTLDKRERVCQLMCESLRVLGNHSEFHKSNLLCFLKWCQENSLEYELCSRPLDVSMLNFT